MCSVTRRAKASRSTASAPPASTWVSSAQRTTRPPKRRSSSLSRPDALVSSFERSELEQTSSAKSAEWCAGVILSGFISWSSTAMPRSASCQAASQPARPAPITVTLFILPPSPPSSWSCGWFSSVPHPQPLPSWSSDGWSSWALHPQPLRPSWWSYGWSSS